MPTENDELLTSAKEIVDNLKVVGQFLRRVTDADIARSGLTAPQIGVLDALAETDGLSLKDLSERVALSHSTVSGIVDRLQRQELVHRQQDTRDRRLTRVFLSERVKNYIQSKMPSFRVHPPILEAIRPTSPEERSQIREGLTILRRLLEEHSKSTKSLYETDKTEPK